MKLTKEEKTKIFWSLLNDYPQHERGRNQAKLMFEDDPKKYQWALDSINKKEKEHYDLIKKFSDELGMEIPDRIR